MLVSGRVDHQNQSREDFFVAGLGKVTILPKGMGLSGSFCSPTRTPPLLQKNRGALRFFDQWLFLVPLKGGR